MADTAQEETTAQDSQLEAVPYDFKSPSRVPKEQTNTIELIHQKFAQMGATGLGTYLNSEVDMFLESLEQINFQEYILSLSTPTCVATFDMQPLNGYGVIEVNAPLIYATIDRILGGDGEVPAIARSFTELEMAIVRKIIQLLLKEFGQAWAHLLDLRFSMKDIQTHPSFIRVISQREACLVATIKARIASTSGLITVCIPYVNLEPVSSKLGTEQWTNRYGSTQAEEISCAHQRNFQRMDFDLTALLGTFELSSSELLSLQPGDILDLGAKTTQPIEVRVAGEPKFLANPGLIGRYRGVMIQSEIVKE